MQQPFRFSIGTIALSLMLLPSVAHANAIWPTMLVEGAIKTVAVMLVSILIEAVAIFAALGGRFDRAIKISAIINGISMGAGWLLYGPQGLGLAFLLMLVWPHASPDMIFKSAAMILLVASYAVELISARLLFKKISLKRLWLPLLIGNVLTYLLAWRAMGMTF